jgi:hypothetical protein
MISLSHSKASVSYVGLEKKEERFILLEHRKTVVTLYWNN